MKYLGSITNAKDLVTKEYVDSKVSDTGTPYGTCSTAAGTVAKTVTVDSDSFSLETGVSVRVKFSNSNTATSPTLNVNGTGAKAIKRYGTTAPSTSAASSWNAGSVIDLTYDGTYWVMHNFLNTTYSSMTVAEYEAGEGTTARTITPARLKAAILTWASAKDHTHGAACDKDVTSTVTSNSEALVTSGAVYSAINDATGFVRASASARGSASSLSLSASAVTKVALDTWITQTDTAFTFSDGGIKCPYDGVVVISGSVYVPTGSSSVTGGCYIKKGTAEITSQYIDGVIGGVSGGSVSINVSAGDIIYLCARRSNAGTCAPNNTATHLDISYVQ